MSFERPTLTTLVSRARDDINARMPGADSRLRRSTLDVLARVHAGAMHGAYGMLDSNARFLPDVADTALLERWAAMFGLTRKPAAAATGNVTLTGDDDAEVPEGTILLRADGARYATAADATIASGTATVAVSAETAGAAGAMDAGQSLTFLSPVAGVDATAAVAAGGLAAGADAESDADLRGRLLLRLRQPVRGGAASDYVYWALEVAGVTRAWIYPNWDGLGTVKLLFVMDGEDDIIPDAGAIAAVDAWIAARRPVCADVTVAAPVADPLDLTIALTPDSSEVRAAVEAELRDLIAREAEPGGTLLISHIREAISIAAGETDHVLTVPSANVTAAAGEITTLGTITWA
ncbi:baseplate J/gp47 family protein [Sphingomonas canadensis]|uniref:Baseplate J/gp47 family protein n=1 Tax=Sphingomonas canadensis TaxID=1219257 RepID=A0ABW3H440_9SPHN|nr:baseplate J/gp47 family protein [Sphingomonas canadensis]MCW3835961.1 baseplate J/gp47 family protein [Sphingomonas canadensis]